MVVSSNLVIKSLFILNDNVEFSKLCVLEDNCKCIIPVYLKLKMKYKTGLEEHFFPRMRVRCCYLRLLVGLLTTTRALSAKHWALFPGVRFTNFRPRLAPPSRSGRGCGTRRWPKTTSTSTSSRFTPKPGSLSTLTLVR